MRRFGRLSLAVLGLLAVLAAPLEAQSPSPSTTAEFMTYPKTERVAQEDDYQGTTVADPYRWLEDDVRQSARVAAWVEAENQVTEAYLKAIPEREEIRRRVTELWNYERYSAPEQRAGKYVFQKNDGLQNQSVLYVSNKFDSGERVLIDPNQWSEDGTVALSSYSVSDDGKLMAYTVSEAGSDWKKLHVLQVDSGEMLPDELRWIRWGPVAWTRDNKAFYYSRYPEPAEGEQYQAVAQNMMIYFHRLGTSQGDDRLIYKRPDQPDWTFGVDLSEDGNYLFLAITKSTDDQNQLWYTPVVNSLPAGEFLPLFADFENQFSVIGTVDDKVYLLTDYQAPTKRVVAVKVTEPGRDKLTEIIPAVPETLEAVSLLGDNQLIANYLKDVATQVRVFDVNGKHVRDVALPGIGSASGFGGKQADTETFYAFSSFTTPPSIYRYDVRSGESRLIRQAQTKFEVDRYTVTQVFYNSKDGTRIPMFLAHAKELPLDGNQPTLLYGYGGFNISLMPAFSTTYASWLDLGGVVAVANLRGGGEYGEPWHVAGKLHKKQNVFDDFIAAAEWLIAQKYTRPECLAVMGGSNGGLLVGAVVNQRPELFGAALPAVGVMDMLRFHLFTAGRFWRDEYGSSENSGDFANLIRFSPYHNIRSGVTYPAVLVTTADTDDRVVPMHSFKYIAALQHADTGPRVKLVRIETRAGHGAGTPTTKMIDLVTDKWAFLVKELGMKIRQR